jgi:hypothetical protein
VSVDTGSFIPKKIKIDKYTSKFFKLSKIVNFTTN